MRKFNKLFILISIILLSFICISCRNYDETSIREIFELEQKINYSDNADEELLKHYEKISKNKSKIVSRLKKSVKWSKKLNRDVDYYSLNYLLDLRYKDVTFGIDNIEHLKLIRYNLSMKEEYIYDADYVAKIKDVFTSIPYVKIEYEKWPYVIESYNKEYKFSNMCLCGEHTRYDIGFMVEISVYYSGYVHVFVRAITDNNVPTGHFISLIPLENNYKDIISDSKLEVYIEEEV